MKGLTFVNDPWKLRTDQVFTLILMWKQDPWMRRCMDVHIVKKIAEYIKIDLSEGFNLPGRGRIWFRRIIFPDPNSNYYGWFLFDSGSGYSGGCFTCLRPQCDIHQPYHRSNIYKSVKDISSYRNRFEFDDPIKDQ